jgi:hypothetical protein
MSFEEVRQFHGADSLAIFSLEGMLESMVSTHHLPAPVLDGKYPTLHRRRQGRQLKAVRFQNPPSSIVMKNLEATAREEGLSILQFIASSMDDKAKGIVTPNMSPANVKPNHRDDIYPESGRVFGSAFLMAHRSNLAHAQDGADVIH